MILEIPGGSVQLSSNPIWCNVSDAFSPAGVSGYLILLKVISIDGVILGGPFIDAIAPDAEGKASFNISGIVDIPIDNEFQWPRIGAITSHINSAYNIQIVCGEHYIDANGNPVDNYSADSQNIQILNGGISDYQIGIYNDAGTSFYKEIIEKGKFLTSLPDNLVVSPNQPVKLWMMSPYVENTLMKLIVTGHYEDGTIQSIETEFEFFRDGLFEFDVDPLHYGIDLINEQNSRLEKFGVAVININNGNFGDTRAYFIDHDYYEHNAYLFAANKYSCIDVIWLNGSVKVTSDISGSEGLRPIQQGSGSRRSTIITTSKTSRKKYSINTGHKSEQEIEALEDVYLSKALWLLYKGKLIPVTLANKEQLLYDSQEDNIHSAELELLEGHYKRFA